MFTEVEVANQWHYRAHNNLCPTLHKRTWLCFLFVSKLVSSWPKNEKKMVKEQLEEGDLYICITKCRTLHSQQYWCHWLAEGLEKNITVKRLNKKWL